MGKSRLHLQEMIDVQSNLRTLVQLLARQAALELATASPTDDSGETHDPTTTPSRS